MGSEAPVDRFREMWASELAGAALYRALAEHASPDKRTIFESLAEAEARHAAHWARLMAESGVTDLRPPRLPLRVRVLGFLARRFGTETVLPIVMRAEAADADKYRGVAEAPAGMAAQEAAHGQVISALSGGDTAGGRIAASEGRHRAGVGGALRAGVFGVQDGLLTNLALVMGFAGGSSDPSFVLAAGLLGLLAGAFSMAAGEWNSVQSQRELQENELRIEREELAAFPKEEAEELELIYQAKGIDPAEARAIVRRIMSRPDVALDTLAREELGIDPGRLGSPWVAAITSFVAFAAGAFVPLIAFLFGGGTAAIVAAILISAVALLAVSAGVSVVTGRPATRIATRFLVFAVLATVPTFLIGRAIGVSVG